MTSLKQLEANRRNALKSTGPKTEDGKQRSRRNALRHGFTAETVIEPLENPEEYRAFEGAIVAEYLPQTPVEQELVHRLASLFWRLRRATSIETGCCGCRARFSTPSGALAQMQRSQQPGRGLPGFSLAPAPSSARMLSPAQTVSRSFTCWAATNSTRRMHRGTSRSAFYAWRISTARLWTGSAAMRRRSGDSSRRPSLRSRR